MQRKTMVGELKIEPIQSGGTAHNVYIDGQRIRGVRCLALHMDLSSVPTAEIEIYAHDIETISKCNIDFYLHPESLRECVTGIAFEAKINDEFKNEMRKSIETALDETGVIDDRAEMANYILDSLLGDMTDGL